MVTKLSNFLDTSFSTFSANDTNNTGITYPGAVVHTTSLTPGLGIGVGLDYQVETSDNNTETGMRLETVTTDVTNGSEDFDFVVKLMQNGAAASEKLRVSSTGNVNATGVVNASAYFINGIDLSTTVGTGANAYAALVGAAANTNAANGSYTSSGTVPILYGGTGANSSGTIFTNIHGFTSTATAGGTTVWTNANTLYNIFTGSTTQTITLPNVTTLTLGWSFHIVNNSTGNLTVNSSGGNLLIIIPPGTTAMVTCVSLTGTTAASWEAGLTDFSLYTGTGYVVMNTSPTLVSPTISTIVNTGTLTLPTATDTLVGRATTDTLTNKRINPRVNSAATFSTPATINSDNFDQYAVTGLTAGLVINADAGTPVDGQKMILRVKDNGTTRTLTFVGGVTKGYRPVGVTLTAAGSNNTYATTASKTVYFGMIYNAADSRWDINALALEA